MDMDSSDQRALVENTDRNRVAEMLARYPELSLEEEAFVIRFLRKGPPLEVGLLTSNEAIRPQLDRFREEHADQFSLGMVEVMVVIAIIVAVVAFVALLWNAGAPG